MSRHHVYLNPASVDRRAIREAAELMNLKWREQLSVGNEVIDSDHKNLIEIINQVGRNLGAKNQKELTYALERLYTNLQRHSASEMKIADAVS